MADSTPTFRGTDSLSATQAAELVRLMQSNQLRRVLLGKLASADMNTTADQAITINLPATAKYVIRQITVANASANLSLAIGGFYAAASKSTPLVANTQVYSALSAAGKYVDATLATLVTTDLRTEATLYLSLTTAQGSAATADVYIYGDIIL